MAAVCPRAETARPAWVTEWNATDSPYERDATIAARFEAEVDRRPDAPAVYDGGRIATYGQLDRAANRLAHELRDRRVARETPVALAMERSLETIAAILGVLKAGGAYVPLEPSYPQERLAFILEDTRAPLVLAQPGTAEAVPDTGVEVLVLDPDLSAVAARPDVRPVPAGFAEDLAYIMYTSGSTGRPKGVEVLHRGVLRLVRNSNYAKLDEGARVLQVGPLDFDPSTFELWAPLLNGGAVVVYPPGRPDPRRIGDLIRKYQANAALLVSGLLHQVVDDDPHHLSGLTQLLTGGDVLSPAHARRIVRELPDCRLVNLYGPTESTLCASYHVVSDLPAGRSVPIGRPLANTTLYLLDEASEPVEPGKTGEVYIGGDGVARGYLNLPELTADRFVPDRFSARPDGRLYRTGDLARLHADGELEFLGRADDQVKIRGYRVELGEVEAHLGAHPAVAQAAVLAREDLAGRKRLVGYVMPGRGAADEGAPTPAALRAFLAKRLPQHMIPASFAALDAFPITSTGKLDRAALPDPAAARGSTSADGSPPKGGLETEVAGIWSDLLGVQRIGREDDFFELGGDSLLGTLVLGRLRASRGVELPIDAIFEEPTIAGLARQVAAAESDPVATTLPALRRGDSETPAPLAPSQRPAWFFQRLEPASNAYQFHARITFTGALDADVMRRALAEIVRRHEALRTTFEERAGQPVQIVHPPWLVDLEQIDLVAEEDPNAELERLFVERLSRPFDIAVLPLVRWTLVHIPGDRRVLLHVEHHLVHDGWSFALLLRELDEIYRAYAAGEPPRLPEPTAQIGDYARWQEAFLSTELAARQLDWWRSELEGVPVLELAGDVRRPARRTLRGDALRISLEPEVVDRLRALARSEGTTLFTTMLAAFAELLRRYSSQRDFAIGSGFANRRLPETEGLVGMVVNTVALRMRLEGDPLGFELIRRTHEIVTAAHARQDVPFERVASAVCADHGAGDLPIYQVLFSFHDAPQPAFDLPGLKVDVEGGLANGSAKADLNVVVVDQPDRQPEVIWEFSRDLLSPAAAEDMLGHYGRLLAALAEAPDAPASRLAPPDEAERARLDRLGKGPLSAYEREASVPEVFAVQVARDPSAPAVTDSNGHTLSYGDLDRRSNRLAHRLVNLGVGPETCVALHLERNGRAVEAMLAVLKAGGAYVPVDLEDPPQRIGAVLARARVAAIITDRPLHEGVAGGAHVLRLEEEEDATALPTTPPPSRSGSESLAYLMHTSGSTGAPKGVEVVHRAIVRLVRGADYVELGPDETTLAAARLAFDASTFEIWGALLNGGRVVVLPDRTPTLARLEQAVRDHEVSILWLTAGLFHEVADQRPELLDGVRQVLAGGDVLSPARVTRVLAARGPDQLLINGYGPTEATTFTCAHRMRGGERAPDPVPIGRPIANTRVRILDDHLRLVPVGVPGELFIGGDGLARGYRDATEFTTERFLEVDGERLYRTGDRVRWRRDGALDFLGRMDRQLKVRGFRVEPAEIEQVLVEHADVRDAAVVGREARGGLRLAAYVVGSRAGLTHADLRRHLARRLPGHMLPTDWAFIDRLPLTVNGKLDRAALPAPASPTSPSAAPGTSLEQGLAAIWEDVLEVGPVSLDDDFFELGGHSLLAVALVSEVERVMAVRLPLASIFEAPTVRELAREVRDAAPREAWQPLVPLRPTGDRPPLFAVAAGDGNVLAFAALARRLAGDQPLFGLQPRGLDGRSGLDRTVEDMASTYLDEVRSVRPYGPYLLLGRCLGATVAFEMAQRLVADGEEVPLLVALDSDAPLLGERLANGWPFDDRMRALRRRELPDVAIDDLLAPAETAWFIEWLRAPVFGSSAADVSRYLHQAWLERPDLQEAWPDLEGEDGRYLVRWAWEHGRTEMALLEALLPQTGMDGVPPTAHPSRERLKAAAGRLRRGGRDASWRALDALAPRPLPGARARLQARLEGTSRKAIARYVGRPYAGRVTLVRSREFQARGQFGRWWDLAEAVEAHDLPTSHIAMMREPDVALVARFLGERIERALDGGPL